MLVYKIPSYTKTSVNFFIKRWRRERHTVLPSAGNWDAVAVLITDPALFMNVKQELRSSIAYKVDKGSEKTDASDPSDTYSIEDPKAAWSP